MLVSSIQTVINPQVLTQYSFSAQEAVQGIMKILFEGALTDEARKEFHVFEKPTEYV